MIHGLILCDLLLLSSVGIERDVGPYLVGVFITGVLEIGTILILLFILVLHMRVDALLVEVLDGVVEVFVLVAILGGVEDPLLSVHIENMEAPPTWNHHQILRITNSLLSLFSPLLHLPLNIGRQLRHPHILLVIEFVSERNVVLRLVLHHRLLEVADVGLNDESFLDVVS